MAIVGDARIVLLFYADKLQLEGILLRIIGYKWFIFNHLQ